MGKVTGFLDFERIENKSIAPKTRVKNFKEFVIPFSSNSSLTLSKPIALNLSSITTTSSNKTNQWVNFKV